MEGGCADSSQAAVVALILGRAPLEMERGCEFEVSMRGQLCTLDQLVVVELDGPAGWRGMRPSGRQTYRGA